MKTFMIALVTVLSIWKGLLTKLDLEVSSMYDVGLALEFFQKSVEMNCVHQKNEDKLDCLRWAARYAEEEATKRYIHHSLEVI